VSRLVEEGVDVAAGEAAVSDLRDRGGDASFVRADMRVDGDVEHMVGVACERHGGIDILVNNAGGWGPTANFPDASPLQWGSVLDLNLRGPMLATQLVLEPMRRRGGGAVVNVASVAGIWRGAYDSPEYGAAKAGLIRFTTCMGSARDEAGVRVNCVVPDWIETERAKGELAAMTPEARAAEAPLVDPVDLADAIVELIADDALFGRVVLLLRGEPRRMLDPDSLACSGDEPPRVGRGPAPGRGRAGTAGPRCRARRGSRRRR
jgi:NAD(P)-dependent dehydrogenase (short-subunit alcohol dehydrogenase family)